MLSRAIGSLRRFAGTLIGASYDAARTHRLNQEDFARALASDADSDLIPHLSTLRARARHMRHNSGYVRGIVNTYAVDVLGPTGPTLRLRASRKNADREGLRRIKQAFDDWCEVCDLRGKRHLFDMLTSAVRRLPCDGEFLIELRNSDRAPGPVKLRLVAHSIDRLDTPPEFAFDLRVKGGIRFDEDGRPATYYLRREHPGNTISATGSVQYDAVPAANMIHFFEEDDPEQTRGEPPLASVTENHTHWRSFARSTVIAARVAAKMGMAIIGRDDNTQVPLQANGSPLEIFNLEEGVGLDLPGKRTVTQMRPEHPASTYREFKRECLSEMARPLNMPWIRAACDASESTFSSARLDLNAYFNGINFLRAALVRAVLIRIWRAWEAEYRLAVPVSAAELRPRWVFDPTPSVDPLKEEKATTEGLGNLSETLDDVLAAKGKDTDEHWEQLADEKRRMDALGLTRGDGKSKPEEEPEPAEEPRKREKAAA